VFADEGTVALHVTVQPPPPTVTCAVFDQPLVPESYTAFTR
jgi:hypothetical protein